jgi:isoleucyl-tRNA synthetase
MCFFEGPPSANGKPGIHHVMARAIKDIFCRFHTLKGYRVERKAGWDTHGLPVELGVEKELGITKEDIGVKLTIEEYNEACRKAVMRYTDIWNELTHKMGYWVDMESPYVTYENKYIESVWWLLKQLDKKDLLYKGYTIQPYSPAAGTGLSSHELNQPGAYQDVKDTTDRCSISGAPGLCWTHSGTCGSRKSGCIGAFAGGFLGLDHDSLDIAFQHGLNCWSHD